jgi:ribosomal protein S18 acetylase RimI-like enzyme
MSASVPVPTGPRTVRWQPRDLAERLDEVLLVYSAAMGYSRDVVEARRGFVAAHTHRRGFRAVATLDDANRLVGFGYGYTSRPGQWWHDQVRAGLDPDTYHAWMADCFELVELHVLPDHHGGGLGWAQLSALLDGVENATVVLSTPETKPEGTSRAWRLYRRADFRDVLRRHRFPGDERPFAVLGRALPFTAHR